MKIYIADDHSLVAQGIASLLKKVEKVSSVHTFKNGKLLYDAALIDTPDVVFLDIEMPVWDGRTTLSALKSKFPFLPCLMLSMMNDKYLIKDCISRGAVGYLNKDCKLEELTEALERENEEIFYSKEVLKVLSGVNEPVNENISHEPLSDREKEVLKLLCEGLSAREIGEKLYISTRTVETHKMNTMQKLHVNSVGKLISYAFKNNLA
ncbi:response regulator [Penaeicola halotolerans]|uniref:response regulator n=1 Tax=Penaeicola halotolerans TaxID=2793196 RepID=UPI001CF8D66E|nr:response regulator transcription factor [Penaeicola halotolerans]